MAERRGDLKGRDDRRHPGPIERGVMVLSMLITVALFGFVVYHGVVAPERSALDARVTGTTPTADGLEVEVTLVNDGSAGFRVATVEVACGDPPAEVVFENVPAGSRREATVVCPAGAKDVEASVVATQPP